MAYLNKEVKSLDEDNWMFEGPRSHIHLISTAGFSQSTSLFCCCEGYGCAGQSSPQKSSQILGLS